MQSEASECEASTELRLESFHSSSPLLSRVFCCVQLNVAQIPQLQRGFGVGVGQQRLMGQGLTQQQILQQQQMMQDQDQDLDMDQMDQSQMQQLGMGNVGMGNIGMQNNIGMGNIGMMQQDQFGGNIGQRAQMHTQNSARICSVCIPESALASLAVCLLFLAQA